MTSLTPEVLAELRRLRELLDWPADKPFSDAQDLEFSAILHEQARVLLDAAEERDRLRADLARARDAALEHGAQVCDSFSGVVNGARLAAHAIRALKGDGGGG